MDDRDGDGAGDGGDAPCSVPAYLASQPHPIGWAAENGGTAGGGDVTATLVTTLAGFNEAAKGTTPAVIYIQGALAQGTATIGSNKTIIGCSGGAALNGHVDVKASANVIIRNLAIVGYNCAPPDVDTSKGGQCQNGVDAVTVDKQAHNLWFDHDAISDGSDGNLDLTHASDYVTISYTKFFYSSKRNDPNDTGASGHRYSNLIGSSDGNGAEDSGHLRITFHHDWWADNVVERQPRVRFGQVHLFDNLWTSTGNHYCIGVGVGADILSENNAFIEVGTPIDIADYVDAKIAPSFARSVGDLYSGTTGAAPADLSPGSVFTPPYAYTPAPAADVEADVRANAGPH
jgi:pectate lyase